MDETPKRKLSPLNPLSLQASSKSERRLSPLNPYASFPTLLSNSSDSKKKIRNKATENEADYFTPPSLEGSPNLQFSRLSSIENESLLLPQDLPADELQHGLYTSSTKLNFTPSALQRLSRSSIVLDVDLEMFGSSSVGNQNILYNPTETTVSHPSKLFGHKYQQSDEEPYVTSTLFFFLTVYWY